MLPVLLCLVSLLVLPSPSTCATLGIFPSTSLEFGGMEPIIIPGLSAKRAQGIPARNVELEGGRLSQSGQEQLLLSQLLGSGGEGLNMAKRIPRDSLEYESQLLSGAPVKRNALFIDKLMFALKKAINQDGADKSSVAVATGVGGGAAAVPELMFPESSAEGGGTTPTSPSEGVVTPGNMVAFGGVGHNRPV